MGAPTTLTTSHKLRDRLGRLLPEPHPLRSGNQVDLLVNGEQYFPALLKALECAQREIRLETYIFANDGLGQRMCKALCEAALRGVHVRVVLDGFGAATATDAHVPALLQAGAQVRIFRPKEFLLKPNPRRLRRMHRKLVVVDRELAFVGGINLIDDYNHHDEQLQLQAAEDHLHVADWLHPGQPDLERAINHSLLRESLGPRFDFAVRLKGPVVSDAWLASEWLWWQIGPGGRVTDSFTSDWWRERADQFRAVLARAALQEPAPAAGNAFAQLLLRDNFRFRRTIEKAYLKAIGESRRELLLANAYFIPGRRLRKALRLASRRGVRVRLLLQGQVEYRFQHYATQALYSELLRAGVEIYEYLPSFLHAKVAVVDRSWATVGSSNLDPLSFLVAREVNVTFERSKAVESLHETLSRAMEKDARLVVREAHMQRPLSARLYSWLCYGLLRLAVTLGGLNGRY